MHTLRLPSLVLSTVALVAACVSDTGTRLSSDAGTDATASSSSSSGGSDSGSDSGSDGGGGGLADALHLGCPVAPSHALLHVNGASADTDVGPQKRIIGWRNLAGPEVGAPVGGPDRITKIDVGGRPAVRFDNKRHNANEPEPDARIRFSNVGKTASGPLALFVVGSHNADFTPAYDTSSVGITYLFSGSDSSRVQLMGRYETANGNVGFGALFFNDRDRANRAGVYADNDFLGGQHFYEVRVMQGANEYEATMRVDGMDMPMSRFVATKQPSTNTTIELGGSDRTDQMLDGNISELVLLANPDTSEVDCLRRNIKQKYELKF